jgi:hypothetical protein
MDMEKPSLKKNREKGESYIKAYFSRHVMREREQYRDRPINRNRERERKETHLWRVREKRIDAK